MKSARFRLKTNKLCFHSDEFTTDTEADVQGREWTLEMEVD